MTSKLENDEFQENYSNDDQSELKKYLSSKAGKGAMEHKHFFDTYKVILFQDPEVWRYDKPNTWNYKPDYLPRFQPSSDDESKIPILKDHPNYGYDNVKEMKADTLDDFIASQRVLNTKRVLDYRQENRPVYISKHFQNVILTPNSAIDRMIEYEKGVGIIKEESDDPTNPKARKWNTTSNIGTSQKSYVHKTNALFNNGVEWQTILSVANERGSAISRWTQKGKLGALTGRHMSVRKGSVDSEFYTLGTEIDNTLDDSKYLNPKYKQKNVKNNLLQSKTVPKYGKDFFVGKNLVRAMYDSYISHSGLNFGKVGTMFNIDLSASRILPSVPEGIGRWGEEHINAAKKIFTSKSVDDNIKYWQSNPESGDRVNSVQKNLHKINPLIIRGGDDVMRDVPSGYTEDPIVLFSNSGAKIRIGSKEMDYIPKEHKGGSVSLAKLIGDHYIDSSNVPKPKTKLKLKHKPVL